MSTTAPNAKPKKKRNLLVDLLCIMLVAAIVMAVIGFIGKDNVMRAYDQLNQELGAAKATIQQHEATIATNAKDLETAASDKLAGDTALTDLKAEFDAFKTKAETDAKAAVTAAAAELQKVKDEAAAAAKTLQEQVDKLTKDLAAAKTTPAPTPVPTPKPVTTTP